VTPGRIARALVVALCAGMGAVVGYNAVGPLGAALLAGAAAAMAAVVVASPR